MWIWYLYPTAMKLRKSALWRPFNRVLHQMLYKHSVFGTISVLTCQTRRINSLSDSVSCHPVNHSSYKFSRLLLISSRISSIIVCFLFIFTFVTKTLSGLSINSKGIVSTLYANKETHTQAINELLLKENGGW